MATMTVMFEVAAADSGKVMQALAGVMPALQNFSMECRERPKTRKMVMRTSKTKDAVRAVLEKNGGAPQEKLEEYFAMVGLSRNSVSPATSVMRAAGEIMFDEEAGVWKLAQ